MKKILAAAVLVVLTVFVAASVSWGQVAPASATWEATWETLTGTPVVWQ